MSYIRDLGYKIFSLIKENPNKKDLFLKRLGFSEIDYNKLINGRLFLSIKDVETIADIFSIKPDKLISYKNNNCFHNMVFTCQNSFSAQENCNKVLDLIDEYIDIKEAVVQN